MAVGSITKRSVEALAAGASLWDGAVRGFGVRRQTGQAVYVVKYRSAGRQRFVTIGRHGVLTPDQARKEAKRLLGQVAVGTDPAAAKAEARLRDADTFVSVAEAYLAQAKSKVRPNTYREAKRYLLVSAKPLHSISVFSIRRRDIASCVSKIESESGAVSALLARSAISACFAWAIGEGYEIESNPVQGSNRPQAQPSRDRVLTDMELKAIWRGCGDNLFGRIVRLLILTGQRREEVGGMRWSELNLDAGLWAIPGTRSKNHLDHTLPLTPLAITLLPARRNHEFVFGEDRGFTSWSTSKTLLDGHLSDVGPWRIHDLRRTVATGLADRGVLPHVIEAVLNHVSGHRSGVAGIYNRARYAGEMRSALDGWSAHVSALVG